MLLACAPPEPADTSTAADTATAAKTESPTWYADIAPLVATHCSACHTPTGIGGAVDLSSSSAAQSWAPLVAARAADRSMPPFYAAETDLCQPRFDWSHDPRLDAESLDLLAAWATAGAPLGDPSTASPAEPSVGASLEHYDLELAPIAAYPATEGDYQICFPLALPIDAPTWIKGIEVLPGNGAVVHHVQVRLDTEGTSAERAEGEPWYRCDGALDGDEIGGYLPGSPPVVFPEGVAMPVEPGAVLAMQVHYHVLGEGPFEDLTRVRVQLQAEPPRYVPRLLRVGNAVGISSLGGMVPGPGGDMEFIIPAGASHHEESFLARFDTPGTWAVFLLANHMHYVGTDARLWVERPAAEPAAECLLHTPRWDFDWQQLYTVDTTGKTAPLLRAGDHVRLTCTYDNSPSNEHWMEQLETEGIDALYDVRLGESALNEMCSALIGVFDVSDDPDWRNP
ncbi:MAG: hypothetical protein ACI8PZ_004077 [Myxococcota bacterium]|jgi:hypothetical protein